MTDKFLTDWKEGKNVVLMCTLHGYVTIGSWEDCKPEIIVDYNTTKGGLDNLDKLLAC